MGGGVEKRLHFRNLFVQISSLATPGKPVSYLVCEGKLMTKPEKLR